MSGVKYAFSGRERKNAVKTFYFFNKKVYN